LPTPTAVIFDFYETLVRLDQPMRERAFDAMARAAGVELPPGEAFRHWREHTTPDAVVRFGGTERQGFDGAVPPFVSFREVWEHRSAELLRHWGNEATLHLAAEAYFQAHASAPLYLEVRETINALRDRYALAVLSDADTGFLAGCLARNDIAFDAVVSSEDVRAYKPHVSMFREVCARLNVAPAQAVYVGDSPWHDIAGARNAGMRAVWLNRHERAWPEDIEPPETTITSLAELGDILRRG
jgi:2-haloacid dehalogenase